LFCAIAILSVHRAKAGPPCEIYAPHDGGHYIDCHDDGPPMCGSAGSWYWLRSPDEEKRVVAALYNRYCIRCHGGDGRGVWDIPDVPNFTNAQWQACRSDGQLARIIIEGRGAVMPPFRGSLTLEEAWAMARYLRTFLAGSEESRPDYGGKNDNKEASHSEKASASKQVPHRGKPAAPRTAP
jgi:hypothetical protein